MTYRIVYSRECEDHFQALVVHDHVIVLDAVDERLTYQPTVETRSRQLLRPNPLAPWEPRVGNLASITKLRKDPGTHRSCESRWVKEPNELRILCATIGYVVPAWATTCSVATSRGRMEHHIIDRITARQGRR